jgi:hypothetical protein
VEILVPYCGTVPHCGTNKCSPEAGSGRAEGRQAADGRGSDPPGRKQPSSIRAYGVPTTLGARLQPLPSAPAPRPGSEPGRGGRGRNYQAVSVIIFRS